MQELENRILNYENTYLQESKEKCLDLLQKLSDEMIATPRLEKIEDLQSFEAIFSQLKSQYLACISSFVQ